MIFQPLRKRILFCSLPFHRDERIIYVVDEGRTDGVVDEDDDDNDGEENSMIMDQRISEEEMRRR